jgi:hypothetical protein
MKIAPMIAVRSAQRRNVPSCPAQNAEIRYPRGRLRELYWETYETWNWCVKSAYISITPARPAAAEAA